MPDHAGGPASDCNDSRSISSTMLGRLKEGDARAWEGLVDLLGPVIYQCCRRAGLDASDAADIQQEVFRAMLLHLDSFRREESGHTFRGWVWTITRNKIADFYRGQKALPRAVGGTTARGALNQVPETGWDVSTFTNETDFDRLVVHRALDLVRNDFAEKTWAAFCQTTALEQSSEEVAQALGMTKAAVRKAKSRVLKRLRDEWDTLF